MFATQMKAGGENVKKHKISFSFSSLLMLLTPAILGKLEITVAVLTAAALHELGHIAAGACLGIRLKCFSFDLLGARLHTDSRLISYGEEIVLCLAGPFVNVISAFILLPFFVCGYIMPDLVSYFFASSVILGAINLLPVKSFDGGRVLDSVFHLFLPERVSSAVSGTLSFLCIFTLWCASVYLLIRVSASLSFFIFSVSVFVRLFIRDQ